VVTEAGTQKANTFSPSNGQEKQQIQTKNNTGERNREESMRGKIKRERGVERG
jgi:hypothetical protein